jgi:hypothetical protein
VPECAFLLLSTKAFLIFAGKLRTKKRGGRSRPTYANRLKGASHRTEADIARTMDTPAITTR